jgi:hypothetical protein
VCVHHSSVAYTTHTLHHTYTTPHIHYTTQHHTYTTPHIHYTTHTLHHTYTTSHIHYTTHTLHHTYTTPHIHYTTHTLHHTYTTHATHMQHTHATHTHTHTHLSRNTCLRQVKVIRVHCWHKIVRVCGHNLCKWVWVGMCMCVSKHLWEVCMCVYVRGVYVCEWVRWVTYADCVDVRIHCDRCAWCRGNQYRPCVIALLHVNNDNNNNNNQPSQQQQHNKHTTTPTCRHSQNHSHNREGYSHICVHNSLLISHIQQS